MRVLITGASGFIGRHCVELLRHRSDEVHAVSRHPIASLASAAIWHPVDLTVPGSAARLFADLRPTHLLHLAWYTVPGRYWTSPENLRWTSVSLDILREFAAHGGNRVVMAGSCAEYEWKSHTYSEFTTRCRPSTLFGISKHGLNTIADYFATLEGLSYAWARIFFLYGPHEHPARLVSSVIRALLAGERARCSPGTQARDFLYVEDAAQALLDLLACDVRGAVNIGSGEAISVRAMARRIADALGQPTRLDLGALPAPTTEPPVIRANIRRLTKEVGWRHGHDIDSGLEETIRWWEGAMTGNGHTS